MHHIWCIIFVLGGTVCGLNELPPTSSCIRGHIRRGAFLVHEACTLISNPPQSEEDYFNHGWGTKSGVVVPLKFCKPLPQDILGLCGCQSTCTTKQCKCVQTDRKCSLFCHGKATKTPCKRQWLSLKECHIQILYVILCPHNLQACIGLLMCTVPYTNIVPCTF